MNCNDYKEAIAADPSEVFDGAEHAAACESCATFRDEMQALNRKIANALKIPAAALTLPELAPIGDENAKVIDLPFESGRKAAFGRGPLVWIGLAASIVLVTVLGIRLLTDDLLPLSLSEEILAHLDHEPSALVVTNVSVGEQMLNAAIRGEVAEMDRDIGIVTYAKSCEINGNSIPHLVIQGKQGPITLLLLPDEMVDSVMPIEGSSIRGVILPVNHGSIAIIGQRGEPLEALKEKLSNSVKWRI